MNLIFKKDISDDQKVTIMKQRSYQDVKRICMMGKSEELANRVTFKLNELICWQIDEL